MTTKTPTMRGPFTLGVTNVHGVTFRGEFNADAALRFAWSMCQGTPNTERGPKVVDVAPYYYDIYSGEKTPA